LTSDNAPNYHSQRWGEAKSVPERSSDLRNRKRNSYPLDPFISGIQDVKISGRIPDDVLGIIERQVLFGVEPADRSDEIKFHRRVSAPLSAFFIMNDADAVHRLNFLCSDEDRNKE
jgi:hypothetical protein